MIVGDNGSPDKGSSSGLRDGGEEEYNEDAEADEDVVEQDKDKEKPEGETVNGIPLEQYFPARNSIQAFNDILDEIDRLYG